MSQRAMFTAVIGLRNQAAQMDVIANNISNANSMGYKRGRITYLQKLTVRLSHEKKLFNTFNTGPDLVEGALRR